MTALFGVELDKTSQKLLADNGIELIAELRKQGLDVKESAAPAFLPPTDRKSIALIILASAAAAPLVANGIVKVLNAIKGQQDTIVEEFEDGPVLDAHGKPTKDSQGNTTRQRRKVTRQPASAGTTETYEVELLHVLKISQTTKR